MKRVDLAPGKYDVVLTTYEMVVSDASYFAHQYYRYIVLDEAQRIKNDNSLIGQACRRLRGAGRLLITGTPLQNDLHELWCLLNFLFPECFEDSQMFDAAFSKVKSRPDRESFYPKFTWMHDAAFPNPEIPRALHHVP